MAFAISTTVTAAAASYDLTTLATVKEELSISTNANDAALKRYISSASAAAAQYCNRVFAAETITDQFLPVPDPSFVIFAGRIQPLQLSRWPVVMTAPPVVTENRIVLVAGTDYLLDPLAGSVTRLDPNGNPNSWRPYIITVSYTSGYVPIPLDVDDAVVRMVTRRFASKGRDPNLKQLNVPGVIEQSWWIATGTDSGNMAPDISDILDNYRVPVSA